MAESAQENIGQRLDQVRKREGLSQGVFCDALGISRSSLQNYANGNRDLPTSILAKLLELYSVDPSWMIQGDVSEIAMRQKSDILAQIREISMAIEHRADDQQIILSSEERWRLTSQLYTLAIVQSGTVNTDRSTSDFLLDQMFANNGFT